MKKSIIIFLGLFLLLSISIVAAQALPAPAQLPGFLSDHLSIGKIEGFFNDLLIGGTSGADIISRLLLVMLLTAVLFQPANKIVNDKPGLAFLVSFLVSVLGIRFIPQIELLLLPYGALAIAVSAIVPLLLFGAVLMTGIGSESPTIRKIGWSAFGGAFFFLWVERSKELGDLSYIYFGIAAIALALLLFDGTIQNALIMSRLKGKRKQDAWRELLRIENELRKLRQDYNAGIASGVHPGILAAARKDIIKMETALADLYRIVGS